MVRRPPEADGIIVGKLDRLARALTVQEAILALVWREGGKVFTAEDGEVRRDDPDDPMRTAIRQVQGVFAELDRKTVVKRLRDGRKAKAAAGRKSVGAYAYGYHGNGTGRDRDAAPESTEQAAVRRIAEMCTAGKSYREIAAALDAEGRRPRRAANWSAMSVRNVAVREGITA
jgi:DNA invertase Pin-like site-specific DNA recombinase